jgi:predicted dehydrogenase
MRSYFKKTPWRIYQDFLYGGGIHAIDLAVWIANEPVIKAYASTGIKLIPKYKHPEDYHINLFFKSGMQACVWVNARVVLPIHKSELEVYGEKGTLLSENKSGTLLSYKYKQAKRDYQREYLGTGYRSTLNTGVKIVNEYITGISKTHYPLPDINEAVEILKVVDMIDNLLKENH